MYIVYDLHDSLFSFAKKKENSSKCNFHHDQVLDKKTKKISSDTGNRTPSCRDRVFLMRDGDVTVTPYRIDVRNGTKKGYDGCKKCIINKLLCVETMLDFLSYTKVLCHRPIPSGPYRVL